MLKATAQTSRYRWFLRNPSGVASVVMAAGALVALVAGSPFNLFLAVFLATGAVACALASVAQHGGHRKLAGGALVCFGVLLFVLGILLFAPQPLWVGQLLVVLGAIQLWGAGR